MSEVHTNTVEGLTEERVDEFLTEVEFASETHLRNLYLRANTELREEIDNLQPPLYKVRGESVNYKSGMFRGDIDQTGELRVETEGGTTVGVLSIEGDN